ncbi:hypothetical protein CK485_07745 [Streptomyces sp. ICBB 8177]|nr:hypothetical protein CK485_07745 [Streptomyces sp. ICBB 8177]
MRDLRAVWFAPRWERAWVRHGRWLLDAEAHQPLEHLDLRGPRGGGGAALRGRRRRERQRSES